MVVTHKLTMNLEGKERTPWIEVSQWDAYTRRIRLHLFEGKKEWKIPEDVSVVIHYRKSDGTCGEYDTLPNGEKAWEVYEHALMLTLAPQVLTAAGKVFLFATIIHEEAVLNTFALEISVLSAEKQENDPDSEDYFMLTGVLSAPQKAEIGQYLRVLDVNADGKAIQLEAVDLPDAGVDEEAVRKIVEEYYQEHQPEEDEEEVIQADWDQEDETQPDFVKNKPFGLGEPTTLLDNQTIELIDGACDFEGYELHPDTFYELELDGVKHQCYSKEVEFLGTMVTGIGNVEGVFDGTLAEGDFALYAFAGFMTLMVLGATQCTVTLVERRIVKLSKRFVETDVHRVKLNIFDDDPYLYTDIGETMITYDQLLEIATSGALVTVEHPLDIYTIQYPALIRFGDENYASVWTVLPVSGKPEFDAHYTAEYEQ